MKKAHPLYKYAAVQQWIIAAAAQLYCP